MLRHLVLMASVVMICVTAEPASATTAHYKIDFNATWSLQTHPNAFTPNAHFSALIGGVHNDQVSFWSPGSLATTGIQRMAELGQTSPLQNEVQSAITAGTASSVILGGNIGRSPGSAATSMFQVSSDFPLVTLVTMVAPSPDWFAGVHGLDLRSGTDWAQQVSVDLFPYDAGTDDGVDFTSSDLNAVPHHSISLLGTPFKPTDPRLGTFIFTRLYEGRTLGDYNMDGIVNAADYTVWRDSLGRSGADLAADGDFNGVVDASDYSIWQAHLGASALAGAVGANTTVVPESATWTLLTIALATATLWQLALAQRRRFRLA